MDQAYRIFQKGQDSTAGEVVRTMKIKSIITQPLQGEVLSPGPTVVLGAAYGGEAGIERVEVSLDKGKSWMETQFFGPHEPFAWRQWQFVWEAKEPGEYTIMSRATDSQGHQQPMSASWNVLGYGNNGVEEHAVTIHIRR